MTKQKKAIRILGLCAFIISCTLVHANAQSERALLIEQIENDHARLELSEDQKEPYTDITLKYTDQLKAIKKSSGNRMSKINKVKSLRKSKNEEMKGLLSKKQYESYLALQKERWEKMKNHRNK